MEKPEEVKSIKVASTMEGKDYSPSCVENQRELKMRCEGQAKTWIKKKFLAMGIYMRGAGVVAKQQQRERDREEE